jgi:hypothetical protein
MTVTQEIVVKLNQESRQRLRQDVAQAVAEGIQEGVTRAAQSAMEGVTLETLPGPPKGTGVVGEAKPAEGQPAEETPEPAPAKTPKDSPRRSYPGPEVTKPAEVPVTK